MDKVHNKSACRLGESMHSIMVLDDDVQVREGLVYFFEDEGFSMVEAGSGEEALEKLKECPVDLVIVDLRLPGMNGTAFISKAHEKWPDVKFIMYTGSLEFNIPNELLSLGCVSSRLFHKPLVEPELMIEEISRTM